MANTAEHPRSSQAIVERRGHPREKIQEVSYIDLLDGKNGGVVLNISETGLLVQSALKITDDVVSRLRFRLPASDRWIEARAKLVWIGESGKEAGIQFLDLSEESRTRIEQWVADGKGRTASRPTTEEPPAPSADPTTGRTHDGATLTSHPSGSARQQREWRPPSFARPGHDTSFPWWGLGRVILWLAIAALVAFLGIRYYPRIPHLPVIEGWMKAHTSPASSPKASQSPAATGGMHSPAAPPQAQSPGLPPNPLESGASPASSPENQSSPAPLAPNAADSQFGNMVTQTLSPGPAPTEPKAAGIRTQPQKQPRAASDIESSDTSLPAPAVAPSSSHDTILVGAPALGSPPARVLLETEPVSASSMVAITASRSILVPASYDRTEQVQLGKLVSYVSPVYSPDALAREIEGTVRVRAFIAPSGEVQSVRLLGGPAALAPAAMNAVRKWRYTSTLLNGQAIATQADFSVFFRLH